MKNKEKLRPSDESLFCAIGKHRPEIMKEFLRLILNDDTLEFKGSSCKEITTNVYGYDIEHHFIHTCISQINHII